MKVKYYTDGDILVITLSKKAYDFAEQEGDFIVHYTKDYKPVRIEILDAHKFIKEASLSLPDSARQTFVHA